MQKFNFLVNFNLELTSLFLNNGNFLSCDFIKNANLKMCPQNHDELDTFMHELNNILDILFNIFNYPYIETRTDAVIKRSELVNAYSEESFKKTIRDASLWKESRGEMKPELVHSIEYNDTSINYENIFIKFAFEQIIDLISQLKEFSIQSTNSLSSYYGTKEASLSKLSIYQNLSSMKEEIGKYIFEDGQNNKNYELLIKIHSKVKHLKQHKFYLRLKNYKFKLPVNLTNTILHDRRYNKVYRFYKDSLMITNVSDNFDNLFYNYSLIRFINYLTNNVANISTDSIVFSQNNEKVLEINKPIKFKYNNFNYLLTADSKKHEIYLTVNKLDHEMIDMIKVMYTYKGQHVDTFGYDGLIVFTNNNLSDNYNNIVEINYEDGQINDLPFENTLLSTQILIKAGNKEILKCPYCGSKEIVSDENSYHCLRCNGEFKRIEYYRTQYIWVKNLWRSK